MRQRLFQVRKVRKRGKRVQLDGKFLISTEEILNIAEDATKKQAKKHPRGRPCKSSLED
ncbi:hypothetical protein V1527DRAFT_466472 [Lipomyces starkeyi]